jgi:hypothetical protein
MVIVRVERWVLILRIRSLQRLSWRRGVGASRMPCCPPTKRRKVTMSENAREAYCLRVAICGAKLLSAGASVGRWPMGGARVQT